LLFTAKLAIILPQSRKTSLVELATNVAPFHKIEESMNSISRRSFLGASALTVAASALPDGVDAKDKKAKREDTKSIGRTPHTKFAVNVEMWWKDLPFLQRIENAAAFGFPAIEFWGYEGKDLDVIKKKCDELGLTISQFTAWGFEPAMNNPTNHELLVKKIEESCQVAKKLGCKLMCVVGGNDQPGMGQEEMHWHIIDGLKKAAPIAEANGVTLILEPMNIRVDHKGHSLYGSAPAIRICRAVNSPNVKINWDLYHLHITEGDLCGHLREGIDWVGYLQLADHPGRNEPFTGEIYFPAC